MCDWKEEEEHPIEDEEYRCHKCGEIFYMRVQKDGRFDFDEGIGGRCEKCGRVFCDPCGDWRTFGGEYGKICQTCFCGELLGGFAEWRDVFKEEYCDLYRDKEGCDACPFFFKKGCMMMLLNDLLETAFHTEDLKKAEIERLQHKNKEAVKEWEIRLKEAGVKPKNNKESG
jgi:hypothetical protein